MAQKCLKVFCQKYKLGLLIGRRIAPIADGCDGLVETTDVVKYQELKKAISASQIYIFTK